MRLIECIFLASILMTWNVSAVTRAYTEYTFTKLSTLVIQGEVVECRANGSYCVRVDRVLKGQYTEKLIDLPYRYFYTRLTPEWNDLPLSKSTKAVLFLQYTKNGEHDVLYKMLEARCLNADAPQNCTRIPYEEGYEIILGEKGAQVRGTQEELEGLGSSIRMIDQFIREKKVELLVKFFVSGSASRRIALDALYNNHKMFDMNKKVLGEHLVQCLGDSDSRVRNHASWVISHFDYREATTALNSYTNTPDDNFREALLSTLKIFEMRGPKKSGP